jgi:hypothetical protein
MIFVRPLDELDLRDEFALHPSPQLHHFGR